MIRNVYVFTYMPIATIIEKRNHEFSIEGLEEEKGCNYIKISGIKDKTHKCFSI